MFFTSPIIFCVCVCASLFLCIRKQQNKIKTVPLFPPPSSQPSQVSLHHPLTSPSFPPFFIIPPAFPSHFYYIKNILFLFQCYLRSSSNPRASQHPPFLPPPPPCSSCKSLKINKKKRKGNAEVFLNIPSICFFLMVVLFLLYSSYIYTLLYAS